MSKALIAMSGGVDSSVAAYLMKEAGYECIGATMKLYDNETACVSATKTCCSVDDVADHSKLTLTEYGAVMNAVIAEINESYPNACISHSVIWAWKRFYNRHMHKD